MRRSPTRSPLQEYCPGLISRLLQRIVTLAHPFKEWLSHPAGENANTTGSKEKNAPANLSGRYDYIYLYNQKSLMPCNRSTHSLQLDTIRMVEEFIQEHSGEYKRRALWENLPKKIMYQTFKTIIEYLLESGKIASDSQGTICWIHDPEMVQKYSVREDLRFR